MIYHIDSQVVGNDFMIQRAEGELHLMPDGPDVTDVECVIDDAAVDPRKCRCVFVELGSADAFVEVCRRQGTLHMESAAGLEHINLIEGVVSVEVGAAVVTLIDSGDGDAAARNALVVEVVLVAELQQIVLVRVACRDEVSVAASAFPSVGFKGVSAIF